MLKTTTSKCKLCRREGAKLFLKGERCNSAKCAMTKRNYPPGQHGQKGYPRLTEYGTQLREKQKAKKIYGLREIPFKNYYLKASKKTGNTAEIILQLLELRLDNVVYRSGFAPSRNMARQLINHGHIKINNRKVDIPSYTLKPNDVISIKTKSQGMKIFAELAKTLEKLEVPVWLKLDKKALTCTVLSKPTMDIVKPPFALNLIVEFYSR